MQKTLKKTFALILAVMLCLGVFPFSLLKTTLRRKSPLRPHPANLFLRVASPIPLQTRKNLFQMKPLNPDPKRLSENLLR